MAFTGAATVVVAQIFQLVDVNGNIVGTLSQPVANISSLNMLHLSPGVVEDSALQWNESQGLNSYVLLNGPKDIAASGTPASLKLDTSRAFLSGGQTGSGTGETAYVIVNRADIGHAGDPTVLLSVENDFGNDTASILLQANLTNSRGEITETADTQTVVQAVGPLARGLYYGMSFHQGNAAGPTLIGLAKVNVLTVAVPRAPVAGGMLVITGIIGAAGPAAVSIVNFAIEVNGAIQVPGCSVNNLPVGQATPVHFQVICAAPVTGAGYNVVLTAQSNVAASYNLFTNSLQIAYYR